MAAARQTPRQPVVCEPTCRATGNVPPAANDPDRSSGVPLGRQKQLTLRRMRRRASEHSTVPSRHPNRIRKASRLLNTGRERTLRWSSSGQHSSLWTVVNLLKKYGVFRGTVLFSFRSTSRLNSHPRSLLTTQPGWDGSQGGRGEPECPAIGRQSALPGPRALLLERRLGEDVVGNRDVEAEGVEDELGSRSALECVFE